MIEEKQLNKKEKTFISYRDDDNKVCSGYYELLNINDNFVKFETERNIISIPINRILKIKENKGDIF